MLNLKGKTAIVTGGSRGIGRATCLMLGEAGCNVAFGYHRNSSAAGHVLDELDRMGAKALAVPGDISQRPSCQALFEEAEQRFGRIDIVVANAGIWKRAPIDEMRLQEWQETLSVNLTSVFHTCQLSAKIMKAQKGGSIILVSSTAGQRGEACYSHYAATKGAIIALTKSLAAELGPWNVRVNSVAPGWVTTDMSADVMSDPGMKADILRDIPLGRIAGPEDIAGVILFLASDLARHIQGEIVNVNGGSVLCG